VSERESPRIVGRYAIYGKIASGGMASVHFGRLLGAVGFSRTVALKRLHPHLAEDPAFLKTMIDEARMAARVHHPNVVPTLDVVAAEGELLVVMEYVRGEALSRLRRVESSRQGRVPRPIVSAIVAGALHGLHAAHEATSDGGAPLGIIHRDVSPPNILVGVDGVARVIDFGVAKAAGRLQTTSQGVIKGKVAYMAPEQLAGQPINRTVDVYAMSIVLWELLTGRRLFEGADEASLFRRVLEGALEPPSRYARELPEAVDELVMKGLAREPDDRFATAREMADELVRVIPPAFPTEVGAWVADVARESLVARAALVAEIESTSVSPAPLGATDTLPEVALEGAPDTPSLPSSVSPQSVRDAVRPWRRTVSLAGIAFAGVLGLGVSLFIRQSTAVGGGTEGTAPSPSGLLVVVSAALPSGAGGNLAVLPLPSEPPPASAFSSRAGSQTSRPRVTPRKPSTTAPPGSILYTRPD
jgi:serine/threonine-protein kinase